MKTIIGNIYNPFDNSYCINIDTKERAYLLKWTDNTFNPTKIEGDAQFIIVSEPYKETIVNIVGDMVEREFVNVKSSITNNVYRTLYHKENVIDNKKLKIDNLIDEYYKVTSSIEDSIINFLLKKVSMFEGKYIDLTYVGRYEREVYINNERAYYVSISAKKGVTPSQKEEILTITFFDEYCNEFEQYVSNLSIKELIKLYNQVNKHIEENGYNNL